MLKHDDPISDDPNWWMWLDAVASQAEAGNERAIEIMNELFGTDSIIESDEDRDPMDNWQPPMNYDQELSF